MKLRQTATVVLFVELASLALSGCIGQKPAPSPTTSSSTTPTASSSLAGASSYTNFDAPMMLWSRQAPSHSVIWTNSGGEAGKLLVSKAETDKRPDFIFATQGVLSGLAARGEKVVIIATLYTSEDAILPVSRKPKKLVAGSRTLPIPRSSIEFALDKYLQREGVKREDVKIPKVEKVAFPTIATLLSKPASDPDALDFGILVEPFITNLVKQNPDQFEIGKGGLYQMHYSVLVRESDLKANRPKFVTLLKQLLEADQKIAAFPDDATFYKEAWGRQKDGQPELLPPSLTFKRQPARLQLQVGTLRNLLKEELGYLTQKYPEELKMPTDIDALVDPTLLQEVAPDRVMP